MSLDDVRQPKPVKITFDGEPQDVRDCMDRFMAVSHRVFWESTRVDNTITFYPRAVND